MKATRKGDAATLARFRSERIMEHNGEWFFCTREGTIQGPFIDEWEAKYQLKRYIDIMVSGLAGEISIAPLEPIG